MKQIIESHVKLSLSIIMLNDLSELSSAIKKLTPNRLLIKPKQGICELLSMIKKGNHNRRNTEAILIITDHLDAISEKNLKDCIQFDEDTLNTGLACAA
jgi:hypothetical protein